jgi:hypothetical protein
VNFISFYALWPQKSDHRSFLGAFHQSEQPRWTCHSTIPTVKAS